MVWADKVHGPSLIGTGLGPSVTVGVLSVGPVTLRCCFHQATSSYALTSGLRTAVVMHLDLLREL